MMRVRFYELKICDLDALLRPGAYGKIMISNTRLPDDSYINAIGVDNVLGNVVLNVVSKEFDGDDPNLPTRRVPVHFREVSLPKLRGGSESDGEPTAKPQVDVTIDVDEATIANEIGKRLSASLKDLLETVNERVNKKVESIKLTGEKPKAETWAETPVDLDFTKEPCLSPTHGTLLPCRPQPVYSHKYTVDGQECTVTFATKDELVEHLTRIGVYKVEDPNSLNEAEKKEEEYYPLHLGVVLPQGMYITTKPYILHDVIGNRKLEMYFETRDEFIKHLKRMGAIPVETKQQEKK